MDMSSILTVLSHLAIKMGYMGVFIFMLVEYASIPIPSELILPFFGISAAMGGISLTGIIVVSTLAALLGSIICYYIGFYGGSALIEWVKRKVPSTAPHFDKLALWFGKYGKQSILVARVLPVIRTYVSLIAGAEKIKMLPFIIYSTIGILIWNLILILLGYFVGNNLQLINEILGRFTDVTILICAIIVIAYIVIKFRKRKKYKNI
ncbi:MAG: DedA family protein [Sarcina sp.]